ncbi:MAG: DMT family transporter [Pseudomonadota bacterium]
MQLTILLVALFAVVLWGASAVATKVAVITLSPLTVALLRTVIGGSAALALALLVRVALPSSHRHRGLLLLSGFCGFVAFPLLFTWGVERTSANHASMILASLPVFTGAIAMTWDRKKPQAVWWLGCAIALGGEALLIGSGSRAGAGEATVVGDLMVLASNLFASLGYVVGGRLQREGYPAVGTTFWGAGIYALILLPFLPFATSIGELSGGSLDSWLGVMYLAVGVTIVGYVCWYWALGQGGIERVGLLQFLQPVSGVILAGILLGETVGLSFVTASCAILFGVWVALRAK